MDGPLEQILDNPYRGTTSTARAPKLDKNLVKAAATALL